jgi:hypothetical protein
MDHIRLVSNRGGRGQSIEQWRGRASRSQHGRATRWWSVGQMQALENELGIGELIEHEVPEGKPFSAGDTKTPGAKASPGIGP